MEKKNNKSSKPVNNWSCFKKWLLKKAATEMKNPTDAAGFLVLNLIFKTLNKT